MRERLSPRRDGASPWLGTFHQLARRILYDVKQLPRPVNLETLIPDATQSLQQGAVPDWVRQLRFLAVDEAQDLDPTQVEFLIQLRSHTPSAELLLVGDPDQAIYGFREASPKYLLHTEAYFHQPCQTICLSENHRSARQIVETARALLSPVAAPEAPCHHLLPVRSEAHPAVRHLQADGPEAEAVRIFEEIRTLLALGIPPTEIAVLVRVRAQIPALREEASRWHIPVHTPPLRDQLDGAAEAPPPPAGAVTLLTMHQAKGCEWTVVFIAGCQVGLIPHASAKTRQARHEELRLLYVAVTRARQLLWFSRNREPSPFLAPLAGGCHGAARPSSSPPRWWDRLLSAVQRRGR
jgi:DNA helicase-2/ATP-dependent DNA helicase PcrA